MGARVLGIVSFIGLLSALALGTLRKPAVALAGILCLYGLKQWGQNSSAFLAQHKTIANLSIGILVVAAAAVRLARGQCLFCKVTSVSWLVFALYFYAVLTLSWTQNLSDVLFQWSLHWPYLITIVVVAPLIIGKIDDLRAAFNWTVVIGTVICGLAMFFGTWGSRGLVVYGDVFETQSNALAIASLGGTVLIVGTLSLQQSQKKLLRLICIFAIPLGVAVVLRSLSRGQLVAGGIAILCAWPIAYRVRNFGTFLQFAIGLAALAAIGWLAFDFLQIDPKRWSSEQSAEDAEGRLNAAIALLNIAAANPLSLLFGLGNSSSFHYIGFYPHVAALEVLAEEGLLGFALFTIVAVKTVGAIRRLAARFDSSASKYRATVGILAALFIFEFLLTFKQGSLLSCTYTFAYAMLLEKLASDAVHVHVGTVALDPVPILQPRFKNVLR